MKEFLRLILLGIAVLLGLFSILSGLQWIGLQRQYSAYDHPLIQSKKDYWLFAKGGGFGSHPPSTKQALEAALAQDSQLGIELVLHRSLDGIWIVYPKVHLEDMTEAKGLPETHTWNEMQLWDAGFHALNKEDVLDDKYRGQGYRLMTFSDALSLIGKRNLLLTFMDPQARFIDEIITLIKKFQLSGRSLIRSPFRAVTYEIKKKEPLWVYGSDSTQLIRALIFARLGIESLFSFSEDIVITPYLLNGSIVPSQSLLTELKRQKKNILMEIDSSSEMQKAAPFLKKSLKLDIDGVVTFYPQQVRQILALPRNSNLKSNTESNTFLKTELKTDLKTNLRTDK